MRLEALHQAIREGRLAHALLLVGDHREQQAEAALALAQHLVCDKGPQQPRGCGACGSCLRMGARQSESLTHVEPENGVIKIDQVRPVREALALESWQGARVVMIEQADALNPQSANALLKVIEEPPPKTYFFLLTSRPSVLLSTIRSRSQIVRLERPPPGHEFFKSHAELIDQSKAWWTDLAKGESIHDESWRDVVKDRESALEAVEIWSHLLHQAQRVRAGLPLTWTEVEKEAKLLAQGPQLDSLWTGLLDLKSEIEAQVDRQLAVESFFLKTKAHFQKGSGYDRLH